MYTIPVMSTAFSMTENHLTKSVAAAGGSPHSVQNASALAACSAASRMAVACAAACFIVEPERRGCTDTAQALFGVKSSRKHSGARKSLFVMGSGPGLGRGRAGAGAEPGPGRGRAGAGAGPGPGRGRAGSIQKYETRSTHFLSLFCLFFI